MSFRAIPVLKFERKLAAPLGVKPTGIAWLGLDELAINTRYQRELGEKGTARVRAIAAGFDWRKFTPLIVAPRGDGGFAVIDGQHRAAAALARGDIPKVPCWVVDADVAQQAETFLSINAESARIPAGGMWYARAAKGDVHAVKMFAVANEARVIVLRTPLQASRRRFDQTLSPGEIDRSVRLYGGTIVVHALTILRSAGEASGRCLLTRAMIRATVLLSRHDAAWKTPQIYRLLVDLKPERIEALATSAERDGRGSRQEHVLRLLREHVTKRAEAA